MHDYFEKTVPSPVTAIKKNLEEKVMMAARSLEDEFSWQEQNDFLHLLKQELLKIRAARLEEICTRQKEAQAAFESLK